MSVGSADTPVRLWTDADCSENTSAGDHASPQGRTHKVRARAEADSQSPDLPCILCQGFHLCHHHRRHRTPAPPHAECTAWQVCVLLGHTHTARGSGYSAWRRAHPRWRFHQHRPSHRGSLPSHTTRPLGSLLLIRRGSMQLVPVRCAVLISEMLCGRVLQRDAALSWDVVRCFVAFWD